MMYEAKTQTSISILATSELPTTRHPVLRPSARQKRVQLEWCIVGLLLVGAFLLRLYAALHAGLEVDEPIYRDAAALTLQYGYPTIRPAYLHPVIPFLYHPPFSLFLLAGWFKLWGSTSYLTGRLCSIVTSLVMLLLFYVSTRQIMGRKVALGALVLVGCDPWIIFTNQAIYLENSLMILVILAIWIYWHATKTTPSTRLTYVGLYALAGLFVGFVIIYKQLGGFIVPVVCLSYLLTRKHLLGHVILFLATLLVVAGYGLAMHHAFGALYDAATLDQLKRTLGQKAAPGLNNSASTVLEAIWSRYWMFFITIIALVIGAALTVIRYVQYFLRWDMRIEPVIVSWALGGMIFAMAISLKDPHYLILWIVPFYLVLAHEIVEVFWHKRFPFRLQPREFAFYAQALGLILCLFVLIGDTWGVQARFTNQQGDALQQTDEYINKTMPANAVVLTQNYIGVDITPQFLDITLVTTPQQILQKGVTYMALYWSQSAPVATSLGPVNRYCIPMKTFSGFKDHVEVCKIDPIALAKVANPLENSSRGTP